MVPSEWQELAVQEMIARSIALRAVGRADDARPLLVTAASPVMSAGALTVAFNLGEIIDGLLEADEIRLLEQLVAHVSHRAYPVIMGELQRGRALLHRRNGELPEALSTSERSVTALRGGGNPLALARSLLDQGTILAELGRAGEAAAILEEARELFGDLGRNGSSDEPSRPSRRYRSSPDADAPAAMIVGSSRRSSAARARARRRLPAVTTSSASPEAKIRSGPATSDPSCAYTSSTASAGPSRSFSATGSRSRRPLAGARTIASTTAQRGRRLGVCVCGWPRLARSWALRQIETPDGLDELMDPSATQACVDLDDSRPERRALPLDVDHPTVQPERLHRLDAQRHQPTDGPAVVVRRAVQAGLLQRRLGGRPVLGDAVKHALPLVHYQIDVELDPVQILLEQQVQSGPEDVVVFRHDDAANQPEHVRQRGEIIDAHASECLGSELRLDDGREAERGGGGEQFVQRADPLRPRRRQAEPGRQLTGREL